MATQTVFMNSLLHRCEQQSKPAPKLEVSKLQLLLVISRSGSLKYRMLLNHKMYDFRPICGNNVTFIATANFGHLRQAGTHVERSRRLREYTFRLLWSTLSRYFYSAAIKASLCQNFALGEDNGRLVGGRQHDACILGRAEPRQLMLCPPHVR